MHLGNAGEILRGLKLILYTPKYVWSDSKAKLAYTVFGVAKILCKVTQVRRRARVFFFRPVGAENPPWSGTGG